MKQKTSIIILTYNHLDYTKECIESIQKYTKKGTYEIILIDNFSTDGTRTYLKTLKNVKVVLNDENVGFPKGCNQGIQLANKENDILLLNNDTIVTTNWLENLKTCLYSKDSIGAVGSVCNHTENLQGCDFSYDDFKVMQELAKQNNISDSKRWEEKLFLIGFCLLIKRNVINLIHELDEGYSPGYIEDNDLSLRILEHGFRLMLCHDSFIHHYLGSSFRSDLTKFFPILEKNRNYFMQKWNFPTFAFDDLKDASIKILEPHKKILELDSGIGVTLLKLKYLFPGSIIHGMEADENKRKISGGFTKIYSSFEEIDETYDCILIGNTLEHISEPNTFLQKIRLLLNENGTVIGEIHNIASFEDILPLLKDEWYFQHQNKLNHFTIRDIQTLFYQNGYKNSYVFSWIASYNDEQQKIIESLKAISEKNYNISYYSFRFQI